MQVITLPALTDNYIYLIMDSSSPQLAVVDPGDAEPVLEYLKKTGRRLTAILNTHHHGDHTAGNKALLHRFPGIPVYGGAEDFGRIPGQTVFLKDGDAIAVCGRKATVLDVKGHTRAHIAFYFGTSHGEGDLFSGDTVFGGTIGNLFEGTPEDMFASLQKIRKLPPATRVWCSHEYTLQFVRESARIDPVNTRLTLRLKKLELDADSRNPTVPLSLEEECITNPFFRWDNPELNAYLSKSPGIETFRHLCEIS